MTDEELVLGYARIQAAQACRNLMGCCSYYHSAMRHRDLVALWAEREDCELLMPWGKYTGIRGVQDCFLKDYGDRDDPRVQRSGKMTGAMTVHALDTCVLEVAGDGQTARGCWFSPGHETKVDPATAKAKALWVWQKYCTDFILEDGVWKIWKMHVYPLFKADYYTCWTEYPQEDAPDFPVSCSELLPRDNWHLTKESVYPADQPIVPKPYETYADLPAFQ